ncbi:unnamed protein product [Aphanomyces euteiches]
MESRMQELMSSYYELSDKEDSVSQSKNINAPGFLVDEYVKDMLESMGMDELLRRDDQMIKEIKELDTNMQMLVYENYNKFISATDTIRKMKSNVETMETEVKKVVDNMDKITVQSQSIGDALAPFRSKAMSAHLEEYEKATKYFVVANRILKRYQHIASFKTIQMEAEHIMFGLRTIVQKKFDDENTTPAQVQEYSSLLDKQPSDTAKYIDSINQAFLPVYSGSAEAFEQVFGRENSESVQAFSAMATAWFDGYATLCGRQFQRNLNDFTSDGDDVGSGGYGVLMLILKACIDGINGLSAPLLPMKEVITRTSQLVESSIRFQVDASFTVLKTEFMESLVKFHATVEEKPRNIPEIASQLCHVYVDRIEQSLQRMQPLISTAAHMLPQMSRALSDLVQSRFKAFLEWYTTTTSQFVDPTEPKSDEVNAPALSVTPPFLVLLACVCRDFSTSAIPRCVQVLVECLPNFNPLDPASSLRSAVSVVDVPGMVQLAKATGLSFLQQYAFLHGTRLNALLRTSVLSTNWLEAKEPRAVRSDMDGLVDEMIRIVKSTAEVLGEQMPGANRTNSQSGIRDLRRSKSNAPRTMGSGKQATSSGHMYMDVARLFAKKIHVFNDSDLDITVESVVACIFKIAFKAFGEYIRLTTFSKFGVQQIQIDTEWLKIIAAMFLTQESNLHEIESLLSDVVTNSMERAVDYTLMEERYVSSSTLMTFTTLLVFWLRL